MEQGKAWFTAGRFGQTLICRFLRVGFGALLLAACVGGSGKRTGQSVDLTAELVTLDGEKTSIKDYPGKLLFLNFWATWCGPCRMEMPSMARLHSRLGERGLSIVALTDEDPDTVRAFLEIQPYPFPILLDQDRTLFQRFGVQVVPTTLVLDEGGTIVFEHMGGYFWDSPEMMEKFHKLLSDRSEPGPEAED